MIDPSIDIMGEQIYDYDLVWVTNGSSRTTMACIKKVSVPFRRMTPFYQRQAGQPNVTTGKEDKYLLVSYHEYSAPQILDLNVTMGNLIRDRIEQLRCVKIQDPYILNSNLAHYLIEETRKLKR